MAIHEFRFVSGFNAGTRVRLDLDPMAFRQQQRALADDVHLDGWDVLIPELYADEPTDSRPPSGDRPALRTWTSASVGITRLPVGLVRFVELNPAVSTATGELPSGWRPTGRSVTLWPNGVGVATMEFSTADRDNFDVRTFRRDWEPLWEGLSAEARDIASQAATALTSSPLVAAGRVERISIDASFTRHRMWLLDAEPSADLLGVVRDELVLIGRDTEFGDVCADEGRFCFPGNGFSVEVVPRDARPRSVLQPIAQYYQYWIIAVAAMDDDLHREFTRISDLETRGRGGDKVSGFRQADPSHESEVEGIKDAGRELFFAHRDVLNAMAPQHLAAWDGYVSSWRILELEVDLQDKITAVEEVGRRIREEVANNIARKTTAVVTFLTALTLVSITTGIAAFVSTEERLSTPLRVWLVAVSTLGAVLLFVVSIRPTLINARRRRTGRNK